MSESADDFPQEPSVNAALKNTAAANSFFVIFSLPRKERLCRCCAYVQYEFNRQIKLCFEWQFSCRKRPCRKLVRADYLQFHLRSFRGNRRRREVRDHIRVPIE